MISVQAEDFDQAQEYRALRDSDTGTGAIVTFTGLVRDQGDRAGVTGLYLEHYPGMTEQVIQGLVAEAARALEHPAGTGDSPGRAPDAVGSDRVRGGVQRASGRCLRRLRLSHGCPENVRAVLEKGDHRPGRALGGAKNLGHRTRRGLGPGHAPGGSRSRQRFRFLNTASGAAQITGRAAMASAKPRARRSPARSLRASASASATGYTPCKGWRRPRCSAMTGRSGWACQAVNRDASTAGVIPGVSQGQTRTARAPGRCRRPQAGEQPPPADPGHGPSRDRARGARVPAVHSPEGSGWR